MMSSGKTIRGPISGRVRLGIRAVAPLAWGAVMLWLSLTPSPPQISGVLGWDKLQHAGAYALLTVLLAQSLALLSGNTGRAWLQAGCAALGYGALLEVLQLATQMGRTAEWLDLFADAGGVVLAFIAYRWGLVVKKYRTRKQRDGC